MNACLTTGSAPLCHDLANIGTAAAKGREMLARRFSIVCLMMMLFGMGLSVIVAEASRPVRGLGIDAPSTCLFEQTAFCKETATY